MSQRPFRTTLLISTPKQINRLYKKLRTGMVLVHNMFRSLRKAIPTGATFLGTQPFTWLKSVLASHTASST